MTAARLAALLLLLLPASATSVTVDLVDGQGALTWDTSVSVTSPADNTLVTHPLFPGNRHPHEGWFIYLETFGVLHEFTSFTKSVDGASQDTLSSSFTFLGETFVLDLVYGISAVGPDGLPDLLWSGSVSRPLAPLSPFPVLPIRLFNVFDYDVGDTIGGDSATVTQTTGPTTTLIEIAGSGGVDGQRGVFGTVQYTADTLANVLTQIQVANTLNNTAAPGTYDVAGAFQWNWELCSDPQHPQCPSGGVGTGGLGGFGGFGGFGGGMTTPEPSTAALLAAGLALLTRRLLAREPGTRSRRLR